MLSKEAARRSVPPCADINIDTLVLQGHICQTLKADPGVTALISGRVYDLPPPDPAFPYVTVDVTVASEDFVSECFTDWEVDTQVHVWSRQPGYVEARRIAAACDAALAERHPTFTGFRMGWFAPVGQSWSRDTDGLTSHGVLDYRAHYGPAE